MMKLAPVLVASLMAGACDDDIADRTENAAERVRKASNQLRHERRELAVEVAARADDRDDYVEDIANEVVDVSREASRLAEAEVDFANLRAVRVASLRAEHAVVAVQPLLVTVIANAKPLTRAQRKRLDENLVIFRHRLAQTRGAIEQLQFAAAADWERRDDELAREMAGLFLARDASWQVLDDNHRDEKFPGA